MQASKIRQVKSLPRGLAKDSLLIIDRRLLKVAGVDEWVSSFDRQMVVTGGERLKDLAEFPRRMQQILEKVKGLSPAKLRIVAVGGGSVGDFAGFVASVLKRGVPLIQIPSTWLSAIDSAHGGKTALNLPPYKNQIGTFYPAQTIYLVGDVLKSQPESLAQQALSELAKIALIDSSRFWRKLASERVKHPETLLWKNMKQAIDAKWKVVMKDPYEKKGVRQVLNLGHTFGHFLEGEFGLSHGESVAQGLFFTLQWSVEKKLLAPKKAEILDMELRSFGLKPLRPQPVSRARFLQIVRQDKKLKSDGKVNFVFLKGPGQALIRPVALQDMAEQARKLGWVK